MLIANVSVKCGTSWKRTHSGPSSISLAGSYSRRSKAFSIRSSLPQVPDDAPERVAAAGRHVQLGPRGVVGAGPAVDRHRLLARRVGERVGVRHEVEEVVGVEVRDDDGVDVDVVDPLAQLPEHAVAAVDDDRAAVFLDEVARNRPRRRPARRATCRARLTASAQTTPELQDVQPFGWGKAYAAVVRSVRKTNASWRSGARPRSAGRKVVQGFPRFSAQSSFWRKKQSSQRAGFVFGTVAMQ